MEKMLFLLSICSGIVKTQMHFHEGEWIKSVDCRFEFKGTSIKSETVVLSFCNLLDRNLIMMGMDARNL